MLGVEPERGGRGGGGERSAAAATKTGAAAARTHQMRGVGCWMSPGSLLKFYTLCFRYTVKAYEALQAVQLQRADYSVKLKVLFLCAFHSTPPPVSPLDPPFEPGPSPAKAPAGDGAKEGDREALPPPLSSFLLSFSSVVRWISAGLLFCVSFVPFPPGLHFGNTEASVVCLSVCVP